MLRALFAGWVLTTLSIAQDEPPVCFDDRLKIELVAEHPDLVTPTGIDVDHLGRVFVIESNTHFPPDGYQGHSTDRVLILENAANPAAKKIIVFADGLTHTMSVAVEPIWLSLSGGRKPPESGNERTKDADSSKDAQSGGLRPPLRVFIATRNEILLLTDTDGDLKADETKRLVHLETKGNYPHNGLAGFAFDALGNMFFGFGENLGADYKIIGSDGTTLSGGGEGGNLYRCKPDGSKLERWATGFWNPHASCFDAFGRLFTVDNDPDSRPPCRLLHIIPGGDYGYRFRNGRKGTHPFTSWNGEIPGTLPMVAGTGEAPSGIVCYENDGFPEDYLGTLLVGSWGDHRIDQFVLEPKGASFTSKAKPIVKGGENFRPVGLAVAPDGSLYFSDWVLKDYKLHGKGRVWRVSGRKPRTEPVIDATRLSELTKDKLLPLLSSSRLDVRRLSSQLLFARRKSEGLNHLKPFYEIGHKHTPKTLRIVEAVNETCLKDPEAKNPMFSSSDFWLAYFLESQDEQVYEECSTPEGFGYLRVICRRAKLKLNELDKSFGNDSSSKRGRFLQTVRLLAERDIVPEDSALCKKWLTEKPLVLRRLAVQWVGEEKLSDLRPDVETLLADPTTTPDLFLACLATLQLLDGKPASEFEKQPPTEYVAAMVKDATRPAALRATALRMLPPTAPELDAAILAELLSSADESLRTEAARTLAGSQLPEARDLLLKIAANPQATTTLRAEAIAGLCRGPHEEPLPDDVEALLLKFAQSGDEFLQLEALRSLRGRAEKGSKIRKVIEVVSEAASEDRNLLDAIDVVLNGKSRWDEEPRLPTAALEGGDALAGRRVFFHHNGPLCAKCHVVQGRGGQVGPDLTVIARTMDREKLLASILEPSKEIAPQFTTWVIETTAGRTHTGFILEDNRTGQLKLGTPTGEVIVLNETDIETREPSKTSVMPENLHQQMTTQELRDLLAFLETLK